jgi:hypothetical protein
LGRKNRRFGGFFIYVREIMETIVYIDGYNLFYGCLKHTKDKWLDLHTLFYAIPPQEFASLRK